jgi:hypothetical protein
MTCRCHCRALPPAVIVVVVIAMAMAMLSAMVVVLSLDSRYSQAPPSRLHVRPLHPATTRMGGHAQQRFQPMSLHNAE